MRGMKSYRLKRFWFQSNKPGILICSLLFVLSCKVNNAEKPALIPSPQQIVWNNQWFDLADTTEFFVQKIVPEIPGVPLNQNESYSLEVTNDSMILRATGRKGLFRGLQTIHQLTVNKNGERLVAGCTILDWPAFRLRGFMQDVGRNFQSMEMLKEQIDVLAFYKFNVFHFHVTDNPGWRLESKIYPQLCAPESMSRWPGKYYTQEDFKELVDYCSDRHITLIPEFDLPGHSEAFRKAFGVDSMSDQRVQPVLIDLIDELCSLAPAEVMPYIHLGTDEVGHRYEKPAPALLPALVERITRHHNREVIVWRPGQQIDADSVSITQLWSSKGHPKQGHRYLNSRLNYLNHLDPLAGIPQLFFDRINGAGQGDSLLMGGILCCWNDNLVSDEYDILLHNPVYPGIVTYSETSWKGQTEYLGEKYLAKFPYIETPEFQQFVEFEERLIKHRDLYFQNKPFPYVKQTQIQWRITGPFNHTGDVNKKFPPEDSIAPEYFTDSAKYVWSEPIIGGTVHLHHFFGYPSRFPKEEGTYYAYTRIWSRVSQNVDAWIGFHDWSRSGGRRGGPFPKQGQWHNTNPQVWVNGKTVPPPVWNNPGVEVKSEEIPFSDENYYFREPAKIKLDKGWNNVLLKIPVREYTWKRMFTFIPVKKENIHVIEVKDLNFSVKM